MFKEYPEQEMLILTVCKSVWSVETLRGWSGQSRPWFHVPFWEVRGWGWIQFSLCIVFPHNLHYKILYKSQTTVTLIYETSIPFSHENTFLIKFWNTVFWAGVLCRANILIKRNKGKTMCAQYMLRLKCRHAEWWATINFTNRENKTKKTAWILCNILR